MPIDISDWSHVRKITIKSEAVTGSHDNFPVYLNLDGDSDLLNYARDDGRDVLFTNSDERSIIPHERIVHTPKARADAVWHWHSSPLAVHHEGLHDKTYIGWMDSVGSNWIGAYDHANDSWEETKLLDGPTNNIEADDHNYPAILIRNDGHVLCFYAARREPGPRLKISTKPENISSFGSEITVHDDPTIWYRYVNPVQFSDGTLWLHSRVDWEVTCFTSSDGGESWSAPTQIVEGLSKGDEAHRPYIKLYECEDKVHFSATTGHPRHFPHECSMYHFYYDHINKSYHKTDGTKLGNLGQEPFHLHELTKVYDASGTTERDNPSSWNWDVAVDKHGNPMILMVTWPWDDGHRSWLSHMYHRAVWNGSRWKIQDIIDSGSSLADHTERYYSKGIRFDHSDPDNVYLAKDDENGHSQIYHYRTEDGGTTWSEVKQLSSGKHKSFRPYCPRHAHPDLKCVWLDGHYSHFFPPKFDCGLVLSNGYAEHLTASYYVQVPTISDAEAAEIYMYFGRPDASDYNNAAKVWDGNYLFASAGHHLRFNAGPLPIDGLDQLTIELRGVWHEDVPHADTYVNYAMLSTWREENDGIMIRRKPIEVSRELEVLISTGAGSVGGTFPDTEIQVGQPFRLDVLYDASSGSGLSILLNGYESQTTYPSINSISDPGHDCLIGMSGHPVYERIEANPAPGALGTIKTFLNKMLGRESSGTDTARGMEAWSGWFDLVRVSNIIRSTDYLDTTRANEKSPETFYEMENHDRL